MRHHLPLLETLKTSSFYNFRRHLFGASGTQSHRFRELEWLMGLLDEDLIEYTKRKVGLERKLLANESGAIPSEQEIPLIRFHITVWTEIEALGFLGFHFDIQGGSRGDRIADNITALGFCIDTDTTPHDIGSLLY